MRFAFIEVDGMFPARANDRAQMLRRQHAKAAHADRVRPFLRNPVSSMISRKQNRSWSTSTTSPTTQSGRRSRTASTTWRANDGFVSVGTDHDTPVFAVTTIEA